MNARQRKYNAENNLEHRDGDVVSEPKSLLDIMGASETGAVVVAFCGIGQEIHDGEGGVSEWIKAAKQTSGWHVSASPTIRDYLDGVLFPSDVTFHEDLHLDVPLRSHRAVSHSRWVDAVVSGDSISAAALIDNTALPIYLSRSLDDAREYLENKFSGQEGTAYWQVPVRRV